MIQNGAETMSTSSPLADLDEFQAYLSNALADRIGLPLRAVEEAVGTITAAWSVEIQHMRRITDPHDRFVIHTPWESR